MEQSFPLTVLSVIVILAPTLLVTVLGVGLLFEGQLTEAIISRLTQLAVVVGLGASVGVFIGMLDLDTRHVQFEMGQWVFIPAEHFHFNLKIVFDRLSVPFVMLSFLLCGTIGAFANSYLHREAGYQRFFLLLSVFQLGMVVSSLAGTIETLFGGWELVGLSSALLVAYFHERPNPVRNGARVWSVYRVADAAFLLAAVALHHLTGEGDFDALTGTGAWPDGVASLTMAQATFVGGLLLIAAAGKSALVPFSGWLPRAMEGPTPSSAIFYGALSVHLGAYLMLRVAPILERSPILSAAVFLLGVVTAIYASMAARAQTDIKSALSFASLTQVGIIFAEIGLGLRYIPLIHMIGHACLRTLQLLRAPSLLHDYHDLENAIGAHLDHDSSGGRHWLSRPIREWGYRFAFHRGHLDAFLFNILVDPVLRIFKLCDQLERRWTDWLSGGASRESDRVALHAEVVDEIT